jgi:hypothetical protein
MAVEVLTDVRVEINAVVLSDHAKAATVSYNAAMLTHDTFGFTTSRKIAGLLEWSMKVDFENDEAAGSVGATLFALVGAAAFPIKIRKSSGAISTSNPEYWTNGNGAILSSGHDPLNVTHGQIPTTSPVFVPGGAAPTLLRATT